MEARITVLPGDGVGPEVTAEAVACLATIAEQFGHAFEFQEALIGGAAVDATGDPLPEATLDLCLPATRSCSAPWAVRPGIAIPGTSARNRACCAFGKLWASMPISGPYRSTRPWKMPRR